MNLEKHIVDTMKEWQIKIGGFEGSVRLYYPKESLCNYLQLEKDIKNDELEMNLKQYLTKNATYLGEIVISQNKDRFCLEIGQTGCRYVEENVLEPEFLLEFLKALSTQDMEKIRGTFENYARKQHTRWICDKERDGLGTVMYFEDDNADSYVYCVEEDGFGITYHRFARSDYQMLLFGKIKDIMKVI